MWEKLTAIGVLALFLTISVAYAGLDYVAHEELLKKKLWHTMLVNDHINQKGERT